MTWQELAASRRTAYGHPSTRFGQDIPITRRSFVDYADDCDWFGGSGVARIGPYVLIAFNGAGIIYRHESDGDAADSFIAACRVVADWWDTQS